MQKKNSRTFFKEGKGSWESSLNRRTFIKRGTILGVSSLLTGSSLAGLLDEFAFAGLDPDLAVVQGEDTYRNTVRAVEMLGGMSRFVSKQSRVGLLTNSEQDNPGTYVKPEIVLAVIRMCLDAGAREIGLFKDVGRSYWRRSPLSKQHADEIEAVGYIGGNHVAVPVPNGRLLKKAEVAKALLDWDVFINMPIAKDHTAVHFTGTMKNIMGATSRSTNRFFHFGSGTNSMFGWYDNVEFLSQCIADANLIRRPDLSIFDGTEIVATNGPSGPGKLLRPKKVIAATDAVAADVYGANLLGLDGREVLATRMAFAHEMGQLDLSKVAVREEKL